MLRVEIGSFGPKLLPPNLLSYGMDATALLGPAPAVHPASWRINMGITHLVVAGEAITLVKQALQPPSRRLSNYVVQRMSTTLTSYSFFFGPKFTL